MYKVRVSIMIRSQEELTPPWVDACMDTELPFAPFIGLRFGFGSNYACLGPIVSIEWVDRGQYFWCKLDDDLLTRAPDLLGYEGLKWAYTLDGWTLREFHG